MHFENTHFGGALKCIECPDGQFSNSHVTRCTTCPIGHTSNSDKTGCDLCPEGMISPFAGLACYEC